MMARFSNVDSSLGAFAPRDSKKSFIAPQETRAKEIDKYFEDNLSSGTFGSTIPSIFLKIKELVTSQNTQELEKIILQMMKINQDLNNHSIRQELINLREKNWFGLKGAEYIQKFFTQIYIMAEYISTFYEISIEIESNVKLKKRELTIENFIQCFEDTKNLKQIKDEGVTLDHSNKNFQNIREALNRKDSTGLSQSGYEQLPFSNRIFSKESAGLVLYSIGSAGPDCRGWSQSWSGLVVYNAAMMFGCGVMTSSSTSMTYQFELQKIFLDTMYGLVKTNLKSSLTKETKLEMKKLLPGFDLENSKTESKSETSSETKHTSTDMEKFFHKILLKKELTLADLKSAFKEIHVNDQAKYINFAREHAIKYDVNKAKNWVEDKHWGTILDHLYAKLNSEDKENFLRELKNEKTFFGIPCRYENKITDKLEEGIAYVYKVMKDTNWENRIEGTKTFSQLLIDIYSSPLTEMSKNFLLEIMIGKELKAQDRGMFASGASQRNNAIRNSAFGGLWALTSIASYFTPGLGIFAFGDLCSSIITSITNSAGAITFPLLQPNFGVSRSHKSKESMIQLTVKNDRENQSKNEKNNLEITSNYENLLTAINQLKELKKDKNEIKKLEEPTPAGIAKKYNDLIAEINKLVDFFSKKAIANFVFEANHGEKDCLLFQLTEAILDRELLTKLQEQKDNTDYKEKSIENVNEIFLKIYGKENIEILKKITAEEIRPKLDFKGETKEDDIVNLVNENTFNIFVSQGYKSAKDPKSKFLFSIQCCALLEQMRKKSNSTYENCKKIYFKAVKNATEDKGSLLYDLQKRNHKTYLKRRLFARALGNFLTVGLVSILTVLSVFPPASLLGITLAIIACVADYTLRKCFERLQYSTRINFFGKTIVKSHRNYEVIRSIVDLDEEIEEAKKIKKIKENKEHKEHKPIHNVTTAETVLEKLKTIHGNRDSLIEKLESCLSWEIKADNVFISGLQTKYPKNTDQFKNLLSDIEKKLLEILKQGFDQESALRSVARAQRLMLQFTYEFKHFINTNEDNQLALNELYDLLIYSSTYGQIGQILRTKSMWGSAQYLLVDILLGAICGFIGKLVSADIQEIFPGFEVFASADKTQNVEQFITQIGVESAVFTGVFGAWLYEADVALMGKTESFEVMKSSVELTRKQCLVF